MKKKCCEEFRHEKKLSPNTYPAV